MEVAARIEPAADGGGHPRSKALALRPLLGVMLPLTLGLAWELAVRIGYAEGRLMPPPSRVLSTLLQLARSGELAVHVQATLARVAAGFGAGAALGTFLGALTGASAPLRHVLDPSLQALRAIPSLAWVPLFILWLGIFEASKIALIAVGVFFPVYLGATGSIASIDRKLIEVGRVFRLSRAAMVARVLLPAVVPAWLLALRSGLGLGFMFVVAAEVMGATEGLGYLLVDGQQLGKPDQILAAILAFAICGKLCDGVLVLSARPFLGWQDHAQRRL